MPMPGIDGYRAALQDNLARQHNDAQQATTGIGILQAIQKQQQDGAVKGIMSSDMPDDQKMQMLASGKAGLAGVLAAHQMMQVQEQQSKVAQGAKERAFYSPENQAKYTVGGAPAQPAVAPGVDELGGGPGRPEQPAVAGKFDLNGFVNAGAAAGVVKPEVLLNHQNQQQTRQDSLQARLYDIQTRSQDRNLDRQARADLAEQAQQARRDLMEFMKSNRQGPAPHYTTTADGVFKMNPDGTTTQMMAPDGKPLSGKATADKVVPTPIVKAYTENSNALRQIDNALAEVAANPNAFGLKNMAGDAVNQRLDPKGVTARARIADIGSLKIHDRSGAAVTAAETPRLLPFIPSVNDKPETIEKKLKLFKQQYDDINRDLNSIYGPEQGYKGFGTKAAPAVPAGDTGGWSIKPVQ